VATQAAGADCEGAPVTSQGYNLDSDGTCTSQPTDITSATPGLDALALNAPGTTATHALLSGSPAIDAGDCNGGAITTDQRGVSRPQGAACDIGAFELEPPDADGDGIPDDEDACPFIAGLAEYQGCPAGIDNDFTLHIVDQTKSSGLCPDGKHTCKLTDQSVEVKVFDSAVVGDPHQSTYDLVFDDPTGLVSSCAGAGGCTDGVPAVGDYLAIARYADADGTVYTGRNVSAEDFVDGLATTKFQVIKLIKKNGGVQFNGGKMTVLTGSYLEIISPDYAMWEEGVTDYVYPYIFIGDSDWQVDVCAEVPEGYAIVGVYDANGDLVSTTDCVQTVVANDMKVVAFEVNDLQSPPPHVKAKFKIKHKGKHHKLDLETPGHRKGKDKPGKGQGKGNSPGAHLFPASGVVAAILVTGVGAVGQTRRRHRRRL
jgi:hypothetical protein